jgi:hypothetical protein
MWAYLAGFLLAIVFVAFLMWRFAANASFIETMVIFVKGNDKYRKRRP